jgi:hypothetical protein
MLAKSIIIIGLILVVTGLILLYFPKLFSWFGNLPGDIKIERENSRLFIPLGSMILISVVLTILFNLIGWIISRLK